MKLRTVFVMAALAGAGVLQAQDQSAPPTDRRAAMAAVRQACANDMQTLCAGKQGRGAFACLRDNKDKVSADCKDAMAKVPPRGGGTPPPQSPQQ
jgi:hypothetical protein